MQLLIIILFLLSEVLLQTQFLFYPYRLVLRRVLPDVHTDDVDAVLHMYFASGLLFVSLTTLVLFFASGTYSEKIGYANRCVSCPLPCWPSASPLPTTHHSYVPHANRALRNFNMYLNVRRPPLRTKLPFNPLAYLFPRPAPSPPPSRGHGSRSPSPSPSPPHGAAKRSASAPIPPIPPASNPRGELIFSSRVDRAFRESYERYRAAFERRREERERAAYASHWLGALHLKVLGLRKAAPQVHMSGTATPAMKGGPASLRGKPAGSPGSTPESSRRSSPVPGRTRRKVSVGARGGTPPQHPLAVAAMSDGEEEKMSV